MGAQVGERGLPVGADEFPQAHDPFNRRLKAPGQGCRALHSVALRSGYGTRRAWP